MLWQEKIDPASARLIFFPANIFLLLRFVKEMFGEKNICFIAVYIRLPFFFAFNLRRFVSYSCSRAKTSSS
jgi:hypothetical protein